MSSLVLLRTRQLDTVQLVGTAVLLCHQYYIEAAVDGQYGTACYNEAWAEADRWQRLVPSHGHVVDGRHEALDVKRADFQKETKKGENYPARLRPLNVFALLSFAEMLESNGGGRSYLAV
jgi:hypothetical protein